MKSLLKFSLTALVISGLAACSSGSSSSSTTKVDTNVPSIISGGQVIIKTGTDDKTQNTTTLGGIWASSAVSQLQAITPATEQYVLNIDGKTIHLLNTKLNPEGITDLFHSLGSDVTYGRYTDQKKLDSDGEPVSYLYAYGNVTAVDKIPTRGKFDYQGKATYGSEALRGFINAVDANFSVDFAQKTVDGKISSQANNLNLTLPTATIKDNGFAGSKGDDFIQGQFFGEQATQIGGVFGNTGEGAYLGAFSATQKK